MHCRQCGEPDTRVIDSRVVEDGEATRRRRSCTACGHRFTTFERVEEVPLVVRKRDGGREPFAAEKVRRGIALAVKGRPVSADRVQAIVADIEEAVRLNATPLPTHDIGEAVLEALKEIDPVAALRFASVYKHFEELSDFERAASELSEP